MRKHCRDVMREDLMLPLGFATVALTLPVGYDPPVARVVDGERIACSVQPRIA